MAKGFKGRYFSLAAIVATVSCVHLQATENRVLNHERQIVQQTDEEVDEETASLEDVIVESALPSSSSLKSITSDITFITSEELESRNYRDVLDALRHQTEFFVTQNGGPGQSSGFSLDGMGAEHVLVMIDGIRVNDPTSPKGQALLEHIRLADVKQIEVIKGAQSGVWGADAGGGVINIVTKGSQKGLHLDARLEGGSYTTQNGSLTASYADDLFALKAGFDGYRTDGFAPKTDSTFDAGDIERTYFAQAAFRPTDTTKVEANYREVVSDFDYDKAYLPNTSIKATGSSKLRFYNASVKQEIADVVVNAYGWKSDFQRSYEGNEYEGNEYEGGLKARYVAGGGSYDLGVSHRKSKMDKSYGTKVNSDIRDNAIFGAFTLSTLQDRLIVNAALRYDDYDAYDDKTTGKIGFKYRIMDEIVAKANVGLGYRVPSLYERFGDNIFIRSNPDLQPESTTTYDLSFSVYDAKVRYFYNEITDLIAYEPGAGFYTPGRNVNIDGTSKIQGVQLAYDRSFDAIDSLFGVSYEYLDAEDAQEQRLIRRPRHRATARWDWFITDALDLDLNVNYAADYLDVDYSAYPAKRVQMGEYIVWNAVLNYQTEAGGFYVKVDNIFNEEYEVVKGYNTPETSVYAGLKLHY